MNCIRAGRLKKDEVRVHRRVDPQFWWGVARSCPYATFFHTPLWKDLAVGYNPHLHDQTLGFELPSGVRAVLPLLGSPIFGPFQRLLSSFEFCYGGIIADGPLTAPEVRQIYAQACSWKTMDLRYLENPFAPYYGVEPEADGAPDITHVVPLNGSFEEVFGRFEKSARTAYRRGLREGVGVRRATSLADCRAYFAAYRDAVERWGYGPTYGYRWELFVRCFELSLRYPDQVAFWVVTLEDEVVGGTLAFYWNGHAVAWHGTVSREALPRRAMVVLDTEIIRDAIARGYSWYDLNPSANLEGVMAYKRNFGPVELKTGVRWMGHTLLGPALKQYRQARRLSGIAQGVGQQQKISFSL